MSESSFNPPQGQQQKNTNAIFGQDPTLGSELVPFQTLDSQIEATFQRLGVKLTTHDLSIPEGLSSENLLQLAKAVAKAEEIPQWWWGSLWNYSGFGHGDRKKLTEDPEWVGPTYNEWANQGAAYQLYLEWRESSEVLRQNYARAEFLPRSYFVKALSAPPEKRIELLERCASGEIKSVRELEAEISQLKTSIPAPDSTSVSKNKKITTTDVEAQVQPGLAQTPEEITAAWKTGKKLEETDLELFQLFDKLWYTEGSEKILYNAYRKGSAPLNRTQFKLFMDQPEEWRNRWERYISNRNITFENALAGIGVDKFFLQQSQPRTRKDVLDRYLSIITELCSESFVRKLQAGEILPAPGDVELLGELRPEEMGELAQYIKPGLSFQEALEAQTEAHAEKLKTKLQAKLRRLFLQGIPQYLQGQDEIDRCKHDLCKAVDDATYNELRAFVRLDFDPATETDIDLEEIDPPKIKDAALAWQEHDKDKGSNQSVIISFHDILDVRAKSTPTPQAPEPDKEPPQKRSTEELQAIERIVRLCAGANPEGEASWRRGLATIQTEDLLDWNRQSDENIRRVANLTCGNFKKGLRQALRIVRQQIDGQTQLGDFKNLCISSKGTFQFELDGFYNSIIRFDREQIKKRFRDLLGATEHSPALEKALAQNSISETRLKVLHSMPDQELKYFIQCALYAAPAAEADTDFSFEESPI
jgi:hypothetical protein